jgi:hypothetical protein
MAKKQKKYKRYPSMDKAKERVVHLYFPTKKERDHLAELAEKKGITLTKLIIELINTSLYLFKEKPSLSLTFFA